MQNKVLAALAAFAVIGFTSAALTGCSSKTGSPPTASTAPVNATSNATGNASATSKNTFIDVAAGAGLNFKHDLGDKGRYFIVENTAPGCAFFDYNNDGYLDIFLVQSGSSDPAATVKSRPHCALYLNNRNGTFTDVSHGSGLDKDLGYGQGVAVGDYDNDGYDDLFITSYGGNHLLRNQKGSGRFEDVTKAMGLEKVYGTGYATSAAFGDYDNNGRLDLYVCYYLKWTHAINRECRDDKTNKLDYCSPIVYDPVPHQLLRNTGQEFVDVSQKAGITRKTGNGLAVAFFDYNGDGKQDIFVANDLTPNMLWRNNGNGTFTDVAIETGCAYGEEGKVMAAMGIAIGDYDHSGQESLYITNFSNRPNILFKNLGGGLFEDATEQANLSLSHFDLLSFGCEFFDYDADGWLDLITNNGHVQMMAGNRSGEVPLEQPKQLLHNNKGQGFEEIKDENLLGDLRNLVLGRGLATGDFNNDGRMDVLASNQNSPAQLFENRIDNDNHWLSLKLIGVKSNRNAIGARIRIRYGETQQISSVRGGTSYLSASDRRVYFGLGKANGVDEVSIVWPGGRRETLKNLNANTFYTLTEGKGVTAQRPSS